MGISNALKAATKATEDVLQRFLPAWLPGRTEIAAGAGYVEYAGSPVGNLTPDFVGQRCFDTTAGAFYLATSTTAAGWKPITYQPLPKADSILTKYGATGYDIARASGSSTNLTFGTTDLTHTVSNERPRFSTYTRKCTMGSSGTSEIRISRFTPIAADPTEKAFSIDIYLETHPNEFLGAGNNPDIIVALSSSTTTSIGSNYSRWTFDAIGLRQGWNTLKMRSADTVDATSAYSGNLPYGVKRLADTGTGFNFATESLGYISLTFEHMGSAVVHLDQIRTPAKAKAVLVIGFDANGSSASDDVFINKVAPLFAQYGIRSYFTYTNIYELIYAGTASWTRMATLYNAWGWDCINHTWSHGATNVGRNVTLSSLVAASDVMTATFASAHAIPIGTTFKAKVSGGSISQANGIFDMVATTTTAATYTATGAGTGTSTGTITLTSFLSEVFASDTTENRRLLLHEIKDASDSMKAVGFGRAANYLAYPNNMVPELTILQYACAAAGVKLGRAVRNGYTNVNELGIDNPLNMGSFTMDSGSTATLTSYVAAKINGAISRGDHIQIYGHYILDDTDPAMSAYWPTADGSEYPPANNGNPSPPSASLSGTGGWWYYSQLRNLVVNTIAPAIANGTLLVMSPSEYATYMGYNQ